MFVKLAVFSCAILCVSAVYNGPLAGGVPAAQFPAGINPQSCPNYPDCTNPLVAISQDLPAGQYQQYQQPQAPAPQYQPQQQAPISKYNPVLTSQYQPSQQSQQYSPEVQRALNEGKYVGDGDYHGEGLAEALAPGYSGQQSASAYNAPAYNPVQQPAYNQANAHAQPAQIPAGVDARACPNYPYCHQ